MKLFDIANQFCKVCTWKTLALLKCCLLSLGILIGLCLPKEWTIVVLCVFGMIFVITYIPLMVKFFTFIKKNKKSNY